MERRVGEGQLLGQWKLVWVSAFWGSLNQMTSALKIERPTLLSYKIILLHQPGSSNVTRHLRMRLMTGFILFWGHQIPCFFMTFCMTFLNFPRPWVQLSVSKNSKSFPCFRVFFDLKQFNRHKLWYSPKYVLFTFTSLLSICILSMPCHLQ